MSIYAEEQSTSIEVTCDGFVLEISEDDSVLFNVFKLDGTTKLVDDDSSWMLDENSYDYFAHYDTSRIVQLVHNTPNYVAVKVVGKWDRTSGSTSNYISNGDFYDITFHIFDDTVYVAVNWETTGSITLSSADTHSIIELALSGTSENTSYENSGSETDGTGAQNSSYGYVLCTSTEINVQLIPIYTSDGNWEPHPETDDDISLKLDNGSTTLATGHHHWVWAMIFDTAERSGGKKYSESDRLAIATELQDLSLETLTKGSDVTDLNLPNVMSSGPKSDDGMRHYTIDGTDDNVKFTAAEAYSAPVVVKIEEPFIDTGVSRIIDYFKCDDDAANSTVTATVGTDANWENDSDGSDRNTSTDSTDGMRGKALDTNGGAGYLDVDHTAYDNNFFKCGAALVVVKAQHAYNVSANQSIFDFYIDGSNRCRLHYSKTIDGFEVGLEWGNSITYFQGSTGHDDNSLQQWKTFLITWDSDNDVAYFFEDGIVKGTIRKTNTPGTGAVTSVTFGCLNGRGANGDYIIDRILTVDGLFLLFGAYFVDWYNSYANADNRVNVYWNTSSTTLQIGSGSVTNGGDFVTDGGVNGDAFRNDADGEYASMQTSGNISSSEFEVLLWLEPSGTLSADGTLFYAASDCKVEWDESDNDFVFTYGTATVRTSTEVFDGGLGKHRVKFGAKASTEIYIDVDGLVDRNTTSIPSAPTLDATMYFTANGTGAGNSNLPIKLSEVFISDTIRTPEIPTVDRKPIKINRVDVG